MNDIAAILLGPAGIWFGWWLNQRTTRTMTDRAEERAADREERERVLHAVRLARQVASSTRDLLHGMYLQGTGKSVPQLQAHIDEHNTKRDGFRDAVLALRVLGPSWAVEGAERVDLLASRLSELVFVMQSGLKSEHVSSANTETPLLDGHVREFIASVAERYNIASAELPSFPNYESEGRWQPLGA